MTVVLPPHSDSFLLNSIPQKSHLHQQWPGVGRQRLVVVWPSMLNPGPAERGRQRGRRPRLPAPHPSLT